MVTTGEQVTARDFLAGLPVAAASPSSTTRSATASAPPTTASAPRAIELALEGLYLARKISKDTDGGETIYG